MGPETYHVCSGSREYVRPLTNRVTTHHFRTACRHLLDSGRFVLSSMGFLLTYLWMLITRRLDAHVSGWTLLLAVARRSVRAYRLPARLLRASLRLVKSDKRPGQGSTA